MTDLVPMAWKEERKRLWHPSMLCVGGIFPTGGFTGKFSLGNYRISTQIGSSYHAAQCFSQIRRDGMPVMQFVFSQDKFAVGVKDNEIGVVTRGDASLMHIATSEASRALRHPVREIE